MPAGGISFHFRLMLTPAATVEASGGLCRRP